MLLLLLLLLSWTPSFAAVWTLALLLPWTSFFGALFDTTADAPAGPSLGGVRLLLGSVEPGSSGGGGQGQEDRARPRLQPRITAGGVPSILTPRPSVFLPLLPFD